MNTWEQKCREFNTYRDTGDANQYPSMCRLSSPTSIKDFMGQYLVAKPLKDQIDAISGDTTDIGQGLSDSLRGSMKDFCCAMWARKEYQTRYQSAKQDYDVAKGRAESTRNPAADLSYRGTTFPLGRPLRPDSVPVLIAVTLTFFIFGTGILLYQGNVKFIYTGTGAGFLTQLIDSFRQTSGSVLGITIVGAAVLAGGGFYGVLKTHPEWLGYKKE